MTNSYALSGRYALVTGSTQGIGLAIAQLLAGNGAKVVIHSMNQAECEAVSATIPGTVPLACDLADAAACDIFSSQVETALEDRLDILVHNAAVCPITPFEEQSLDEWTRVQRVNVDAAFQLTKGCLPALRRSGDGCIVFISSIVVRLGWGDSAAYTTSKAAEIGLARHLAAELGSSGIRVNCVLPGLVDTPGSRGSTVAEDFDTVPDQRQMIPVRLLPVDVAHAVAFLVSPAARAITAACLDVNGGWAVG